jgi:ribonucleoside-triphosphate reductase
MTCTKPDYTDVFSFPVSSPDNSVMRDGIGAIGQLEHYKIFREHWCEHNPSITVYVREDEWLDVGAWVYEISTVSVECPSCHTTTEITGKLRTKFVHWRTYQELVARMPKVDWTQLKEGYDTTSGMQELACFAGVCEIN